MSDNVDQVEKEAEKDLGAEQHDIRTDELTALKARADMVGMKYHHKTGVAKLKKDLATFMGNQGVDAKEEIAGREEAKKDDIPRRKDGVPRALPASVKATDFRPIVEDTPAMAARKAAAELVRVRVTCMNPNKKEWEGEIITASNSAAGTFKKYVPFNATDGWHVPRIIYNVLRDKKCQIFHTVTDSRGQKSRKGKLVPEFSVELLPKLTGDELQEIARRQAMTSGNEIH